MYNNNKNSNGTTENEPIENDNSHTIAINIESDFLDSAAVPLLQAEENNEAGSSMASRINMEQQSRVTDDSDRSTTNAMQRNIISFLNRTRTQLGRQVSYPGSVSNMMHAQTRNVEAGVQVPSTANIENADGASATTESTTTSGAASTSPHSRYIRYMLSFSTNPPAETLRSLIRPGSFRYTALNINDNISTANVATASSSRHQPTQSARSTSIDILRPFGRTLRSESAPVGIISNNNVGNGMSTHLQNGHSAHSFVVPAAGTSMSASSSTAGSIANEPNNRTSNVSLRHSISSGNLPINATATSGNNRNAASQPPAAELDDDNDFSNLIVQFLSHIVRYLPFIGILLIKYIHDNIFGIFDIAILQVAMYNVDKSLRKQIAKLSQKSMMILVRDFGLILLFVIYRLRISTSAIDPFGLLITPPTTEGITIQVVVADNSTGKENLSNNVSNVLNKYFSQLLAKPEPMQNAGAGTVTIEEVMTLGVLLYYIAVNDLILKLLTILVKIIVTMISSKVIRHKARARMYVVIEYTSQFYRSLVPIHQWLLYLFNSYTGLEVISGICFTSFYLGAKGFEFVERGKSMKEALVKFIRNMESERQATKDEVDAAGMLCPICHDHFNAPIVLECRHVFCEDCVNTWFKREQTCPMCRAKVSDDPTWQDGATTFFYQLY